MSRQLVERGQLIAHLQDYPVARLAQLRDRSRCIIADVVAINEADDLALQTGLFVANRNPLDDVANVQKATRANSCRTLSFAISMRVLSAFCLRAISAEMLGFVRFSDPMNRAVFSAYPAVIAAWVAFSESMYSSINRACFAVNFNRRPPASP